MKILMRSSMNPLKNPSADRVILDNQVGGNAGNMLFVYSIMRTIVYGGVTVDTTLTSTPFSDERVEEINSEYDCFVIPLANAFRTTFKDDLRVLTDLVRRLTIPCIVIGVGLQAKIDEDINSDYFDFDDLSKEFVKEVLKKSAMIGVRGEITAKYLKKLGFAEERDFTVIGCPSMYMFGNELKVKELSELTPDSLVSVNRKINIPGEFHDFLVKTSEQFKNYTYVPQGIDDLLLLYFGIPISRKKYRRIHNTYPWKMSSEIYASGHELGFTNVPSWLEFLSTRDFSFGTRIHGNIVSVIAGTPAYIFAPDARILELAQYHNINYMLAKDINDTTDIFKIYEKTDFNSVKRGHEERFNHYIDFLRKNNLPTIYDGNNEDNLAPFDKMISEMTFDKGIAPITQVSAEEQIKRLNVYHKYVSKREKKLKKNISSLKTENKMLHSEIERYESNPLVKLTNKFKR